jgi:HSP20 family protein
MIYKLKFLEDLVMFPMFKSSYCPGFTDDFFGKEVMSDFIRSQTGMRVPAINVKESKEDFKIEVAAPGLAKDDFKIDLHNNLLSISSEKNEENEEKSDKYVLKEFVYNSFKRSFVLPDTVDTDKVTANHKDGVLYITIPKREETKEKGPRLIEVQ